VLVNRLPLLHVQHNGMPIECGRYDTNDAGNSVSQLYARSVARRIECPSSTLLFSKSRQPLGIELATVWKIVLTIECLDISDELYDLRANDDNDLNASVRNSTCQPLALRVVGNTIKRAKLSSITGLTSVLHIQNGIYTAPHRIPWH
jgi:hypothetical protein